MCWQPCFSRQTSFLIHVHSLSLGSHFVEGTSELLTLLAPLFLLRGDREGGLSARRSRVAPKRPSIATPSFKGQEGSPRSSAEGVGLRHQNTRLAAHRRALALPFQMGVKARGISMAMSAEKLLESNGVGALFAAL